MVDLIHTHVRNAILRDVAVRTCYVKHETQAVAIEIADAAKHDVSTWPRWLCSLPTSLRRAARSAWPSIPLFTSIFHTKSGWMPTARQTQPLLTALLEADSHLRANDHSEGT